MNTQLETPDGTCRVCCTFHTDSQDDATDFANTLETDYAHIITNTSITLDDEQRPTFAVLPFGRYVYVMVHINELDTPTDYSLGRLIEETVEHWHFAHIALPRDDTNPGDMIVYHKTILEEFTLVGHYKGESNYYGWDSMLAGSDHSGKEAPTQSRLMLSPHCLGQA